MPHLVLPSALSLAANGVVKAILEHFDATGINAQVIIDLPGNVKGMAKEESPVINLFFYRILPSGFHAATGSNDPLMIRLHCLVTPFSIKTQEHLPEESPENLDPPTKITAGEMDLRILGEVIRFFHENPVIGPLSAGTPNGSGTQYTLESILRAPDMEEINHVWTTQGSELPYRTSAVYEFSLVAIDPAKGPDPDTSVLKFGGELRPELKTRNAPFTQDKPGDLGYPKTFSEDFKNQELLIKFVENGERKDAIEFVATKEEFNNLPEGSIGIALAGLKGKTVHLFWTLDGETKDAGKVQIKTDNIDEPLGEFFPKLPKIVSSPTQITLQAKYFGQDDKPTKVVLPSKPKTITITAP